MSVEKLTEAESLRAILRTIEAECDPKALAEAGGYLFRYVAEQRAKLASFEEREPLVHELLREVLCGVAVLEDEGRFGMAKRLQAAHADTTAFVLQPSNSALDTTAQTGHLPGADFDDTKNGNDSAVSHLSSVVEQRFRKPSDSQELSGTCEAKPVNAGEADQIAVSEACKSAERYARWQRAYDDGLAQTRPIDQAQGEVVTLAAEVRRLHEEVGREMNRRAACGAAARGVVLPADHPEYGSADLADVCKVTAERDRPRTELERRNVAHVEPAITAKDRDEWKARALAAEAERDRFRGQVNDLTEQLQSILEQAQREARVCAECKAYGCDTPCLKCVADASASKRPSVAPLDGDETPSAR